MKNNKIIELLESLDSLILEALEERKAVIKKLKKPVNKSEVIFWVKDLQALVATYEKICPAMVFITEHNETAKEILEEYKDLGEKIIQADKYAKSFGIN